MKFRFYAIKVCVACVLFFILQTAIPSFTSLTLLNQESYTQVWRFVTAIFVHGGVAHLLYNLFALALFGSMLEALIGARRFLFVFLSTGILANLVAINFYPSSLGASGAIFGVIGALIALRPFMVVWAFGMPMPMFVAGIIWVVGDVIGTFVPSNVGTIAHLAGIFFGLLLGLLFRKRSGKRYKADKLKLDEGMMRKWEDGYLR